MMKMAAKTKASMREQHAERIRACGLRVTQSRLAVLDVLTQRGTPLSHADVVDALEGGHFDTATLYRNLNDLAEAKILVRTELGDRVWRFELRGPGGTHGVEHAHFTCTICGQVACLPQGAVRLNKSARSPRAVRKQQVEITLRGPCDRCS